MSLEDQKEDSFEDFEDAEAKNEEEPPTIQETIDHADSNDKSDSDYHKPPPIQDSDSDNVEIKADSDSDAEEIVATPERKSSDSDKIEIKPDDSFDEFEDPKETPNIPEEAKNSDKNDSVEGDGKIDNDDSFDDFADPEETHEQEAEDEAKVASQKDESEKEEPENLNKDESDSHASDKIEMKDDDSFDDFEDPKDIQLQDTKEQTNPDDLRLPENDQDNSSKSERNKMNEESFDDFADPEGNDENAKSDKEDSKHNEEQKDDEDFDDFHDADNDEEPSDTPEVAEKAVEVPPQPQAVPVDRQSPPPAPVLTSQAPLVKSKLSLFDETADEYSSAEVYTDSVSAKSKVNIRSIACRFAKCQELLDKNKEASGKFKSLIEFELSAYSNRGNIPSYKTSYSIKELFERKAVVHAQTMSRPSIIKSKRSSTFEIDTTYKPPEVFGRKNVYKSQKDLFNEQILDLDFGKVEREAKDFEKDLAQVLASHMSKVKWADCFVNARVNQFVKLELSPRKTKPK